ncbi:hypothetical protein [Nonomuraea sediminis]|uniref:hypothetical protein n=1 Tax=Nonomuraea sediminis TaxID=2835864 RepID=UPI001BDC5293|nr:hypothetical protein [Nonomuraea sediminis]
MDGTRWTGYLYESHPPDRLRAWARELGFFRFCRAYGGHANDGDHLLVSLRVETENDLLRTFSVLDVPVKRLLPGQPRPVPGVAYSRFPVPMPRFPEIGQPGYVEIAGQRAHLWSHGERLNVSVADAVDHYSVTDAAVASAKVIEALLAPLASQVVDPPQDDRNCVCPRYYPDLW